jgi:hypothetical protein
MAGCAPYCRVLHWDLRISLYSFSPHGKLYLFYWPAGGMVYNTGAIECRGEHWASIALGGTSSLSACCRCAAADSSLEKQWVAYNVNPDMGWGGVFAKQFEGYCSVV